MKLAQIVHNPTAGDGDHGKQQLINRIKAAGYEVNYVSTDDDSWEDFLQNEPDIIFLAGGDGTIHKLAEVLLKEEVRQKNIPVRLMPLGTANNISKTIGIPPDEGEEIQDSETAEAFDCGLVEGAGAGNFFLEGVGMGIFPELIAQMKDNKIEDEDPEEKLKRTLRYLLEIVQNYEPQKAKIKADGIRIKGKFLLLELMNVEYIGPNFRLAPGVDTGDGYFDLVMIPARNRKILEEYVTNLIEDKPQKYQLKELVHCLRVKKAKIKWSGSKIHIDDNLIADYSREKLKCKIIQGALRFIQPKKV